MATILQTFTSKPMARPITTASQTEPYRTEKQPMRPGSEDHEKVPSRRVASREWRDGRREAA